MYFCLCYALSDKDVEKLAGEKPPQVLKGLFKKPDCCGACLPYVMDLQGTNSNSGPKKSTSQAKKAPQRK